MDTPDISPLPAEIDEVDAWRLEAKSARAERAQQVIADFQAEVNAILAKYKIDLVAGDQLPSFEGRKILRAKR